MMVGHHTSSLPKGPHMEPSTPPPDHPVWGPPRDPLILRTLPPTPLATPSSPRRKHTAHDLRRIGGYAALASSAAIIGYMATASAEKPAGQAVIVTVTNPQPVEVATAPTTTVPAATVPAATAVPVAAVPATTATPATTPATTAVPATTTPATATPAVTQPTRTRQAPSQSQSNSSTHGS